MGRTTGGQQDLSHGETSGLGALTGTARQSSAELNRNVLGVSFICRSQLTDGCPLYVRQYLQLSFHRCLNEL